METWNWFGVRGTADMAVLWVDASRARSGSVPWKGHLGCGECPSPPPPAAWLPWAGREQ